MLGLLLGAALQTADAAGDALANWNVCVKLFALQYARSSEPAETAATATLARCQEQADKAELQVRAMFAPDAGYINLDRETAKTMDEWRAKLRAQAIADILDERMKPKKR